MSLGSVLTSKILVEGFHLDNVGLVDKEDKRKLCGDEHSDRTDEVPTT